MNARQLLRGRLVALLAVALAALGAPACGDTGSDGLTVVATTTILGDVVANVAGDDAEVVVLTPLGADPHDFQASAAQVAKINEADLVVANGLGLEEGLEDVLDAAAGDGVNVIEVGPRLDPLPFGEGEVGDDPHIWFDPIRMGEAARIVAAELATVEPAVDWMGRADAYAAELAAADRAIAATLAGVADRRLVTNHDSLAYFADRYDFEVVGTVIPSGSSLADPSSEELAQLIRVMERAGVTVLFAETTRGAELAQAVAAELGEDVEVVSIYSGSLGEPGSGTDTLIGMLTANARIIAEALDGGGL